MPDASDVLTAMAGVAQVGTAFFGDNWFSRSGALKFIESSGRDMTRWFHGETDRSRIHPNAFLEARSASEFSSIRAKVTVPPWYGGISTAHGNLGTYIVRGHGIRVRDFDPHILAWAYCLAAVRDVCSPEAAVAVHEAVMTRNGMRQRIPQSDAAQYLMDLWNLQISTDKNPGFCPDAIANLLVSLTAGLSSFVMFCDETTFQTIDNLLRVLGFSVEERGAMFTSVDKSYTLTLISSSGDTQRDPVLNMLALEADKGALLSPEQVKQLPGPLAIGFLTEKGWTSAFQPYKTSGYTIGGFDQVLKSLVRDLHQAHATRSLDVAWEQTVEYMYRVREATFKQQSADQKTWRLGDVLPQISLYHLLSQSDLEQAIEAHKRLVKNGVLLRGPPDGEPWRLAAPTQANHDGCAADCCDDECSTSEYAFALSEICLRVLFWFTVTSHQGMLKCAWPRFDDEPPLTAKFRDWIHFNATTVTISGEELTGLQAWMCRTDLPARTAHKTLITSGPGGTLAVDTIFATDALTTGRGLTYTFFEGCALYVGHIKAKMVTARKDYMPYSLWEPDYRGPVKSGETPRHFDCPTDLSAVIHSFGNTQFLALLLRNHKGDLSVVPACGFKPHLQDQKVPQCKHGVDAPFTSDPGPETWFWSTWKTVGTIKTRCIIASHGNQLDGWKAYVLNQMEPLVQRQTCLDCCLKSFGRLGAAMIIAR